MWRGRPKGRPLFSKNRYEAHKEGRFLDHASQVLPGFSFSFCQKRIFGTCSSIPLGNPKSPFQMGTF